MGFSGAGIAAFFAEYGGTIAAVTAVAGAGVSVASSIEQGQQKKAADNYNATIASNNAAYQEEAAMQQAERIRKVGLEQIATADAGLAGSGVKLGEGSAVDINRTINQNTEQDAFNALLNGQRASNAGNQTATLLRTAGSNATANSYIGAGATVLGSAASTYNAAKGWKAVSRGNDVNANSNGWT